MAHPKVKELRAGSDKAWAQLRAQLQGMEPHMDKSDRPGQWTTREVLCHLLFEPGWKPVPVLKTFADKDLPVIEDRKSTRLNSSHRTSSYAVFCLKKKKKNKTLRIRKKEKNSVQDVVQC